MGNQASEHWYFLVNSDKVPKVASTRDSEPPECLHVEIIHAEQDAIITFADVARKLTDVRGHAQMLLQCRIFEGTLFR